MVRNNRVYNVFRYFELVSGKFKECTLVGKATKVYITYLSYKYYHINQSMNQESGGFYYLSSLDINKNSNIVLYVTETGSIRLIPFHSYSITG